MPFLSENLQPFLIVVGIAIVYLAILRAVDLNEREPLWSLILLLWCGATAAALVRLLVNSPILTLRPVPAALIEESATLGAVAVAFAVLAAVGRWKGWSEVTDVMDGLVYGSAAGLGFALVDTLWNLIGRPASALAAVRPGPFATLWTAALGGLAHGIFGALIGIGCVAFLLHRSAAESIGRALLGWALAVAAHVGYEALAHGAALSGSTAVLRLWVALAMPLALVVLLALRSLFGERRAIRAELDEEAGIGFPVLAGGYVARRRAALAALLRGDLRTHAAAKALHNRRVQLALARWRERRTHDPARRERAHAEAERLRAAVRQLQEELR
jgi:RsiW-degrading membrane proteinase PrsW (M82 family)